MLERSSSSVLELGLSHKPSTRRVPKAEAQEEQQSNKRTTHKDAAIVIARQGRMIESGQITGGEDERAC